MIKTITNTSEIQVKKNTKKISSIAKVPKIGKSRKHLAKFSKKPFFITLDFEVSVKIQKNMLKIVDGLCELGFLVNILNGESYKEKMMKISDNYPGQIHMTTNEDMKHLLKHSHSVVFLDKKNPKKLKQFMEAGVVPITSADYDLMEFDAEKEQGNAFLIHGSSQWEIFASIVRSHEAFRFAYDWKELQKRVKKSYMQV